MGNPVGVHTEAEVQDLDQEERDQLKKFIVSQLLASEEVRKILAADPNFLPNLMKQNENIRLALKKESSFLLGRLKLKPR